MGTSAGGSRAVVDSGAVSDLTRRIRDEEQQELAFEAHRDALRADHARTATSSRASPPSCWSTRCSSAPTSTGSWTGVAKIDHRRVPPPSLRVAATSRTDRG